MGRYCQLAKQHRVAMSLGGFQEKGPDAEHVHNTHVLVSRTGELLAAYRKVHLFDLDLPSVKLMESSFTSGGTKLSVVDTAGVGKWGCGVRGCACVVDRAWLCRMPPACG